MEKPHQQKYTATSRNRKEWKRQEINGKYICLICDTRSPLSEIQMNDHFMKQHNSIVGVIISKHIDSIKMFKSEHYIKKYLSSHQKDPHLNLEDAYLVNVFYLLTLDNIVFEYD